ncbi:cytochrome c family protein [bacterium]|nr:cytochrome c family protein [bacterium]
MCHNRTSSGKFFDDWEESTHAKAFELLKGDEQKNPECLACHTTGYGKPGGFVSLEETPKLASVQCEMCHGPGEKHIKSKKDNVIPHEWGPEAKTCEKCHNDKNPNWDPNRYEKDGKKSGFIYELAVKKINHNKVFEALGKKPPKTGDL